MESLIAAQRWLYGGIASGLGEFAGGDPRAIFTAVIAAVLFGAIHALTPGHGKTVLVSYHLGQPGKLRDGLANGAILAVTHVGLAVVLVLAGFAVISKVFALGGRTPQFELASGVLIIAIGGFLLWRSLKSDHHRSSRDGKSLAFVTGFIPCPLTTFIMSYALARGMLAAGLTGHCGDDRRHDRDHRRCRAWSRVCARPHCRAPCQDRKLEASSRAHT